MSNHARAAPCCSRWRRSAAPRRRALPPPRRPARPRARRSPLRSAHPAVRMIAGGGGEGRLISKEGDCWTVCAHPERLGCRASGLVAADRPGQRQRGAGLDCGGWGRLGPVPAADGPRGGAAAAPAHFFNIQDLCRDAVSQYQDITCIRRAKSS